LKNFLASCAISSTAFFCNSGTYLSESSIIPLSRRSPSDSIRLRDLLQTGSLPRVRDIEALKVGRHFRIGPSSKAIVGRNKKENQSLQTLADPGDTLIRPIGVPGPTVLVPAGAHRRDIETAAAIAVAYSDAKGEGKTKIRIEGSEGADALELSPRDKAEFRDLMI
jgi:hypothetical protein